MKNKKPSILVVDDDERTRRMMDAMLAPQGYAILMARNGQEAIQSARSDKPDLILMDMMMPVMDGLAACAALKTTKETKSIPVLMLTAVSGDTNRRMAQQVWGADGYLTKPVDLQELLKALASFAPVSGR